MKFTPDHLDIELRRYAPEDWAEYKRACETTKLPTYTRDALELGVCGEAGEVLDVIKKLEYHRDRIDYDLTVAKLKMELGDLLWYMALLGFDGTDLEPDKCNHALIRIKRLVSYAEQGNMRMMRHLLERIMGHYDIDPLGVLAMNRRKLSKRYKEMYK